MPYIPPPIPSAPYDEVDIILNFARVIANDCGISLAGNLLADTQPYTFTMLNLAWRKLQDRLSNNGIESFPQETIIVALPPQNPTTFADPGIYCHLGFDGYSDGISLNPGYALPFNLEIPVRMWQRVTAQNAQFIPMQQAKDGIPAETKTSYLGVWEWRDDAIYFNGANQILDLRIRFRQILPDLDSSGTAKIPLIRCAVALSYLVVEIFAASRGSTVLPVFNQEKEDAIKQLVNQTTRKKQRVNYRRIPYSRRTRW